MLMLIAMVAIMLIAVGIDKGYNYYQDIKWEKERVTAYEEAKAEVETMQATIETLSKDPKALAAYIEENELNYVEHMTDRSESESMAQGTLDDEVSNHHEAENSVSENSVSENSVSENSVSENSVSENSVSENSVSENSVSENSVSENSVSGNGQQEKQLCASYEKTIEINREDKKIISDNQYDFSDIKMTCLGDSITEASNLNKTEGCERMSYPYQLFHILGAEEVVNLGIGGSSIGRYWDNAFVDRYREIPQDTDLIIVMGGTNDGFCVTENELGSLKERKAYTFAGDLDEMLKGLKENYPETEIILVSPLSTVLHDMLRKTNDKLLPQAAFTDIMEQLAAEYDVHYIDLYHSNLLDTHDAAVIHNFMPDGVHGNEAGYRILAEHLAAEIIKTYEARVSE